MKIETPKHKIITSGILQTFKLAHLTSQVKGWLKPIEGIILYTYACGNFNGEVVEIGSWQGKSTIFLAQALKDSGKNKKVNAIDPHTGSKEHQLYIEKNGETFEMFKQNINTLGLDEYVNTIKKTSMEVVKDWNKEVSLIFIDGSHEYEDVRDDFKEWIKFLQIGGTVIMHDAIMPGPKAVFEEFINGNKNFISFRTAGIVVATKIK